MNIKYIITCGYDFYSTIDKYTPVSVCEPDMSLHASGALHVAVKEDKLKVNVTPVDELKPIMKGKRSYGLN